MRDFKFRTANEHGTPKGVRNFTLDTINIALLRSEKRNELRIAPIADLRTSRS